MSARAVGPGDGERRAEAVAGHVDAVAVEPQRVVDADRRRPALLARAAVADVGGERGGGQVLLVLGAEVLEVDAERAEVAAVDQRPGRVRVVLLEGVAEALALGDQDAALVAPELAAGQAEQQRHQGEVEQQVAGLLEVALLGGELGSVPPSRRTTRKRRTRSSSSTTSSASRRRQRRGQLAGVGQPQQVPRRRRRGGAQVAGVLERARQHAADQRDEQQQVDRGEPRRAEDVEQVQPVEHRRERRVVGEVLVDVVLRQRALRQQRARDGGQREQEQQHDRGAHRGEPPPPAQQPAGDPAAGRRPRGRRRRRGVGRGGRSSQRRSPRSRSRPARSAATASSRSRRR